MKRIYVASREKIKFTLIKRFWTTELSSHKRIFCLKRSVFNSVCELISGFFLPSLLCRFKIFYTFCILHIYHPLWYNLICFSVRLGIECWCFNVTNWFWERVPLYRWMKLKYRNPKITLGFCVQINFTTFIGLDLMKLVCFSISVGPIRFFRVSL